MAPLAGTGSPAATPTATGAGATLRNANSFIHQRDGQNVGFGDSHAEFVRTPAIGQGGDNIYTTNGGSPSATGAAFPGGVVPAIGAGGATGAFDICLVPAADGATFTRR
jgi:hypothetical protein